MGDGARSFFSERTCSHFQDVCLERNNVSRILTKILSTLYEADVLSEESILHWHKHIPQGEDVDKRTSLREQVQTLSAI